MLKTGLILACFLFNSFAADANTQPAEDSPGGFLRKIFRTEKSSATATNSELASLSTEQLQGGIKQALEQGFRSAVAMLGQTNGFLKNLNVRIPFPPQLKTIEQGLRKIGQEKLVDDFEVTLNRAAEKAVPAATSALVETLNDLSIQDATKLLTSKSQTAVTEYFKEHATKELFAQFLPIVQEATSAAGATSAYKQVMDSAPLARFSFLSKKNLDLDRYVTTKALDGLFLMIGEEEKRIRENPQARTTELLQKVFGILKK
jgi:hypothetical protein